MLRNSIAMQYQRHGGLSQPTFSELLYDVVGSSRSQGHDRQRRVLLGSRRKNTAINHEEILNVMRLTERVDDRFRRIVPHAATAQLMICARLSLIVKDFHSAGLQNAP